MLLLHKTLRICLKLKTLTMILISFTIPLAFALQNLIQNFKYLPFSTIPNAGT